MLADLPTTMEEASVWLPQRNRLVDRLHMESSADGFPSLLADEDWSRSRFPL